jgi:hypothetical protein
VSRARASDGLAGSIPTMGHPREKVFLFLLFSISFSFSKFFSWRDVNTLFEILETF